jgi:hypothetical protein
MKEKLPSLLAASCVFLMVAVMPAAAAEITPGKLIKGQWYELSWGNICWARKSQLKIISVNNSVAKVEYSWSANPGSDRNDSGTKIYDALVTNEEGGIKTLKFTSRSGAEIKFKFDPREEIVKGEWIKDGRVYNVDMK